MAGNPDQGRAAGGGGDAAAPEAALGTWLSWLQDQLTGQPGTGSVASAWNLSGDLGSPGNPAAAVERMQELLQRDPLLGSIDRAWNANPLQGGHPGRLGGGGARVAHRLAAPDGRPGSRAAGHGRAQRADGEVRGRGLERRRCPLVGAGCRAASDARPRRAGQAVRRPEWHTNPVYRTLKDLYLLASDFLLEESEAEDLEPAERERLRFHLEQFVNATSPTLLLLSNPAALRRAMETGGASIADGARNLLHDLEEGRLTMVEPGRLRAGAQPRGHAGQGGVPQPADRADPVRAADRDRCTRCRCCSSRPGSTSSTFSTCSRRTASCAGWSSRASPCS